MTRGPAWTDAESQLGPRCASRCLFRLIVAARLLREVRDGLGRVMNHIPRAIEQVVASLAHHLVFGMGARQRTSDHGSDRQSRRADGQGALAKLTLEDLLDTLRAVLRT